MIPRRLAAPAPGWTVNADIVVIGSGIAGLVTALRAREHGRVLLVTKALLDEGSTRWAQGGIAAALAPDDTPDEHLRDTLTAGVGLCDTDAVRALVTEGPDAVRRLIELGTHFDRTADGDIALTREGGHHHRRIAHAGGDATGAEISRALLAGLKVARSGDGAFGPIEVIEHALVLDLLLDAAGHAAGITLHVMGEGRRDGVGAVRAGAVVLATGGLGQVFSATTNPEVSTGDGVALALRAGAAVTDLEFVQFHPTVLWLGDGARGQQPLISEAVRGEGAHLIDGSGERFMVGRHELAELAPRDVVAKGIMTRMRRTGASHVFLDGRHLGAEMWEHRFPTILASCREHGIDPVTEPIPVVPAAHYASGGVRTDLWGRTSVPRLYACGEVACTGVHGANRLASNSLLEGLVFADRIARMLATPTPTPTVTPTAAGPVAPAGPAGLLEPSVREDVQRIMTERCGVLRNAAELEAAEHELAALTARTTPEPCVEAWEATNLHTVATAIVAAARRRAETRGSHWREDFPAADDAGWLGHLVTRVGAGGTPLSTTYEPLGTVPTGGEPNEGAGMTPELERELTDAGLDPAAVRDLVRTALAEDGDVDVTSEPIFAADETSAGHLTARQAGVVAGLPVAEVVFGLLGVTTTRRVADGDRVKAGDVLLTVTGPTRQVLRGERTALNLLTHLSGIASVTRRWADAIEGTKAKVRDTRKTLPGLRALQKYAVRCGGGVNHRMGLHDAALIKDNHVAAAGSVTKAYEAIRARYPELHVQVECDTLAQVEEALAVGARSILLDNMTMAETAEAVNLAAGRAELEASGGLALDRARDIAVTGVDYLAVGALTHSAPALDIGLDFVHRSGSRQATWTTT